MQFGYISVPGTAALTASTYHKKNFPKKSECARVTWISAMSLHWYDFVGLFQWRTSDWIHPAFLVHHPPILVGIKAFLLLQLFVGLQND